MKDQFINESGVISEEVFNGIRKFLKSDRVQITKGNPLQCAFSDALVGASLGFFSNYMPFTVECGRSLKHWGGE